MNPKSIVVWLMASLALAQDALPPTEVFRQLADEERQRREYYRQRAAATREASERRQRAEEVVAELRQPYSKEQLGRLERKAEGAERWVARLRSDLALARIASPEERAEQLKAAEAEAAAADEALRAARAPFDAELPQHMVEVGRLNQSREALLAGVGRAPADLGVAQVKVLPHSGLGGATIEWYDAEDECVARLGFSQCPPDAESWFKETARVGGVCSVTSLRDHDFHLWAGGVYGTFEVCRKAWRGKEQILEVADKLVDFPALVACTSATDGTPWQQFTQQWQDCCTRSDTSQRRSDQATLAERARVDQAARVLRELRLPFDPQRIAVLERQLPGAERSVVDANALLRSASVQDPEARKAQLQAALKEERAADQAFRQAMAPFMSDDQWGLFGTGGQATAALLRLVTPVVHRPPECPDAELTLSGSGLGIQANLRDEDRRLAAVRLIFGTPPSVPATGEKLAGKYPILVWDDSEITILAGETGVGLLVDKVRWQNREKVASLVAQMVDLDTIAAWPTPTGLSPWGAEQYRLFETHCPF